MPNEVEKRFNEKFGFGIWDSRAKDGHRSEGISSSDVLAHIHAELKNQAREIIDEIPDIAPPAATNLILLKQQLKEKYA